MSAAADAHALMPPFRVLRDFLDADTVTGLLDYTLANEPRFAPAGVARKINPAIRRSKTVVDLGPYREILSARLLALLAELIRELRVDAFEPSKIELELVAHGDGAFYKRHKDTQTAIYDEVESIRALSGVYYFHSQPKAFSGGALRLYAIGGDVEKDFADIEPLHNSLLIFPSWAPHEVLPVRSPSMRFRDSRFAINCWFHRKKAEARTSWSADGDN